MQRDSNRSVHMADEPLIDWLLSAGNPAVRYLTARDLVQPRLLQGHGDGAALMFQIAQRAL